MPMAMPTTNGMVMLMGMGMVMGAQYDASMQV